MRPADCSREGGNDAAFVLLGLACLVCRFVALISEVGLTTQERKALFAADRARELLADSFELLEDGGLSERSWSHSLGIPEVSAAHASARHRAGQNRGGR